MNAPEFRLYYDENGNVLFYTCEKPMGNFIIVSSQVYFESRVDLKVIDGKITSIYDKKLIVKLQPSEEGVSCHYNDVSIIYDGIKSRKWSLTYNERS